MPTGATTANALDAMRDFFNGALRIAAKAFFAALVFVAAMIIAGGAAIVGLILAAAALVLRFTIGLKPRRKRAGHETLDAHRTPTGWVVDPR